MLAAAAVEARIGEWLAFEPQRSTLGPKLLTGAMPRPAELVKRIVKEKTGRVLDSELWFARLTCLFHLRNALLHYYPEPRTRGSFPAKLLGCISARHITPGGDTTMDWTSRLILPSVSFDAAAAAHEAIEEFDKLVA